MRKFLHFFLVALLFLPLVTISSVSALPTQSSVLILQAQMGGEGSGTASQEFVLLYNADVVDINVTDWCVQYSSAANGVEFSDVVCIGSDVEMNELWLEAGGMVSFATTQFIEVNSGFTPDFTFSAGMAATGGHLRIIDSNETEIDRLGWGTATAPEGFAADVHLAGEVLSRNLNALNVDTDVNLADFQTMLILSPITSGLYEHEILVDVCLNIGDVQVEVPIGYTVDENRECYVDVCPNIDGPQIEIPDELYIPDDSVNCIEIPTELEGSVLFVTELLPNAPSYDTGLEFIEIYNPNDTSVNLVGYSLQLGPSYTKEFVITDGEIAAGEYLTFSDTESGIILPNTSATVRLVAPAGNVVSETAAYNSPADDVSWALIEDVWSFTNQITPGANNVPFIEPPVEEVEGITSVFSPCPAGKFRNPATNRCKNIETAVSQLAPCDIDEFRNPETNRCKKISTTSSALTPCREGQFRNPETNRCKSIAASSTELKPCDEGQERNPETNRCRKVQVLGATNDGGLPDVTDIQVESTDGQFEWPIIAATLFGATGYIGYEWRKELRRKISRLR